jgi:hypothetical protein
MSTVSLARRAARAAIKKLNSTMLAAVCSVLNMIKNEQYIVEIKSS